MQFNAIQCNSLNITKYDQEEYVNWYGYSTKLLIIHLYPRGNQMSDIHFI